MPIENILFSVAILLLIAKIFGVIAERFGIASLVGELAGGIIVGPVLGIVFVGESLADFLIIPIIFLLFMAGLGVKFEDIKRYAYSSSILALLGGLASFAMGFLVGMLFFNNVIAALAIGVVLVSTSDGTMFLFLMKSGEFNTKTGRMMIAITIADDIVGIVLFSFFSIFIKSQTFAINIAFTLLLTSIGLYFIMFTLGSRIMNNILNFVSRFMDENVLFTIPVAFAFFLAYVTDNLGLSIAAGAFLTGMAIANSRYSESVIGPKVTIVGQGFLIPLFYATIGATLVFMDLNIFLILAILAAAVFGKVIGIGIMSRFFGVSSEKRRLMGIMMIPRGSENIAIAQIIMILGVMSLQVYTSIMVAMIVTILITPILLKFFYKK